MTEKIFNPKSYEEYYKDKQVLLFHHQKKQVMSAIPLHYHSSVEFLRLQGVQGYAEVEGLRIPFSEDCLLIIPSGKLHNFCYSNSSGELLASHLNLEHLSYYLNFEELLNQDRLKLRLSAQIYHGSQTSLSAITHSLYDLFQEAKGSCAFQHYLELFSWISTPFETEEKMVNYPETVKKMIYYSENHLYQNPSLLEMAKELNYRQETLSRLFKEHIGLNYSEYLTELRIKKATKLLEKGYNIKQVVSTLGLKNQSYFIQKFKEKKGISPKKYQLGISENNL